MNVSTFWNCRGKILVAYYSVRLQITYHKKNFGLTLLTGGEEEEEEDEETGSERGEESVEVPVLVLPDSLKERLEADMKAILSKSTFYEPVVWKSSFKGAVLRDGFSF
jgi:hypothetical protein